MQYQTSTIFQRAKGANENFCVFCDALKIWGYFVGRQHMTSLFSTSRGNCPLPPLRAPMCLSNIVSNCHINDVITQSLFMYTVQSMLSFRNDADGASVSFFAMSMPHCGSLSYIICWRMSGLCSSFNSWSAGCTSITAQWKANPARIWKQINVK